MKAYELFAVNDFRYVERAVPEIHDDLVLVKVKASGICSSDIPRIFKKGTYHFPTIPGHEFAGEVVKIADEKNKQWLGKRVGVFPLIPCGSCAQCQNKHYEMCENYNYLGSRTDGGFAEYVAVPAWNLIEIPDEIDFKSAAMLEPLAVALHCTNQARIKQGDSVAIVGSGMIAFAVAQWAKIAGATRVCVVARNQNKHLIAEKLKTEYRLKEELKDVKFNVVIEAVGTNEALNTAITLTDAGGTAVLMGNPYSDMTLLRKQLHVVGTWNSSFDGQNRSEWHYVVDMLQCGILNVAPLITHVYDQEKLEEGLKLMKNNLEPYCKVMVLWG